MKKPVFYRILFYVIGLLVLALGLTLNTKTGLGVSPIISVAYSISEIFDQNFGNMTLALYSLFVVIEMILHLIRFCRHYPGKLRQILIRYHLPVHLYPLVKFLYIRRRIKSDPVSGLLKY